VSPADPDRCVLIMDANTFATGTEFHPDAVYQLHVDTDSDSEPDVTSSTMFSSAQAGEQTATVYPATGAQAREVAAGGDVIIDAAPVSFGAQPHAVAAGRFRFFAGPRSDPFFADWEGLMHDF
jgi:hypothetical protein